MSRLIKPTINFTIVSNTVLTDKDLSLKAKGLYVFLISKPDKYQFSFDRIAKESNDGKSSVLSAVQELEDNNYLIREKHSDGRTDYILFNNHEEIANYRKSLVGKKPSRENPNLGKSLVGKIGSISKTDSINKTNLNNNTDSAVISAEKVLEKINTTFSKKYRSIDNFIDNFRYWITIYSLPEMISAIDNAQSDPFWQKAIDPITLFRQRNPNKERVDYIGKLLNSNNSSNSPPQTEKKIIRLEDIPDF